MKDVLVGTQSCGRGCVGAEAAYEALDAAALNGWTAVDMKKDWKRVFAFD